MASPIVSPTGIIHVLGYTPTEGERGVPITVRIHFHPDLADAMYVRLVIGHKAVPTKVRQLPNVSYGKWQLYAAAPPFDRAQHADTKVLISVQALNEENAILDTVTFGQFSYWMPGERRSSVSTDRAPRLQIPDSSTTSLRRRTISSMPTPSPTTSEGPFPRAGVQSQRQQTRLHRRIKSQSLMRTKQPSNTPSGTDDVYAQTPILDLITPLSSLCIGWTPAELAVGRRLVRFSKVQDGRRLIVSCEPIPQEAFNEADPVISCIYRAESDSCYVTSVDVIYLLERLTNGEFPVEEKNRIRRNLEGLRPTTVSKHKPGFGDFFQRIMEFPDPKPRNIEKDLKVFEWNSLGQALEKILSKYSIYTTSAPEGDQEQEQDNSPPATGGGSGSGPGTGTGSPELYAMQLAYPQPDEFAASRFLDQKAAAMGGLPVHEQHNLYDPFAGIDLGELDLDTTHHLHEPHPHLVPDGGIEPGPPITDDYVSLPGTAHSASGSTDASHGHSLPSGSGGDGPADFIGGFGASPVDSVITSSSSSSSSSFPTLGLEARSSGGGGMGPEIASSDDGGDGMQQHPQHPWNLSGSLGPASTGTFKPGHGHHDSLALSDFGGLLAGYDLSKQHAPYALGLGPGLNLHAPMGIAAGAAGGTGTVPGMHHLSATPNGHHHGAGDALGAENAQDAANSATGAGPHGDGGLDFSGLYENYAFNALGDETLTGLDGYL